jgi:hypothetical protein
VSELWSDERNRKWSLASKVKYTCDCGAKWNNTYQETCSCGKEFLVIPDEKAFEELIMIWQKEFGMSVLAKMQVLLPKFKNEKFKQGKGLHIDVEEVISLLSVSLFGNPNVRIYNSETETKLGEEPTIEIAKDLPPMSKELSNAQRSTDVLDFPSA